MVLTHSDHEAEATNFPVKNVGGPRGLGRKSLCCLFHKIKQFFIYLCYLLDYNV